MALGFALYQTAHAAYLTFPVYDTNDRPMEDFKDGLPTYVKANIQDDENLKLEQFLLCTSCPMSYIFGDYSKV